MVNFRRLLAQKLFGIHSVPSRTQVEVQRVYTGLGAEFGQPINDAHITFALQREYSRESQHLNFHSFFSFYLSGNFHKNMVCNKKVGDYTFPN